MKKFIFRLTKIYPSTVSFDISLLVFRILVSAELMMAHGLKKIGIGVAQAEHVPNPLCLPETLKRLFAVSANLFFPVLVILGLFTRIAILPILAVTLTGYFVVHWNDSLLEKDMPFMYSVVYLFLLIIGPGKYSADHSINKRIKNMKALWIIIAILSGAFLPIQAGLNSRLGKSIESPVYASLISFTVGVLALLIYIAITKQHVSWAGLKTVPAYAWLGGALGAFYVTAIILAFPKIGPALTFGLVVAGQMVMAILLDHFKVLVAQQHVINIWRVLGVLLIVVGVIIIRKF